MSTVTAISGPITRYWRMNQVITTLDPMRALLTQIQFLTATDYAQELLVSRHNAPASGAKKRAQRIAAHVRLACAYVDQAVEGPREVRFVPCYYAILNLIKVCILFGSRAQHLDANRWHGAQYDVYRKDSRALPTEEVIIHPQGAISLYYWTLAGNQLLKKRKLALSDIYPYIGSVSSEWRAATGRPRKLATLELSVVEANGRRRLRIEATAPRASTNVRRNELQILQNCSSVKGRSNTFESRAHVAKGESLRVLVDKVMKPIWFYHPVGGKTLTPIYGGRLTMFEEMPLVLAFFHMSSVARYKPEFMDRLRNSRFWPVVASLTTDGLLRFLTLFWSYATKECFDVKS